jgi:hypothetical protein
MDCIGATGVDPHSFLRIQVIHPLPNSCSKALRRKSTFTGNEEPYAFNKDWLNR